MEKSQANLEVFATTLLELAHQDSNLLVVTSDSRGSGKLAPFGKSVPGQIVEVGIAEQNLVGVAAGLAAAGKTVFAVSPGCFLTARSLEQIKNDICYSDRPVKVVGISAGVAMARSDRPIILCTISRRCVRSTISSLLRRRTTSRHGKPCLRPQNRPFRSICGSGRRPCRISPGFRGLLSWEKPPLFGRVKTSLSGLRRNGRACVGGCGTAGQRRHRVQSCERAYSKAFGRSRRAERRKGNGSRDHRGRT